MQSQPVRGDGKHAHLILIYSIPALLQKIQTFIQKLYFNVSKTYIQTTIQCCIWTPFKKINHSTDLRTFLAPVTQFSLNPAPDGPEGVKVLTVCNAPLSHVHIQYTFKLYR